MEFEQLIRLIRTVSESHLTQLELEEEGCRIRMQTDKKKKTAVISQRGGAEPAGLLEQAAMPETLAGEPSPVLPAAEETGKRMVSPLVGTFYHAKTPGEEPFVKVGDRVVKGQVLGLVEAMKLMNEIESEYDGIVTEIPVENGQTVEYGQTLFVLA